MLHIPRIKRNNLILNLIAVSLIGPLFLVIYNYQSSSAETVNVIGQFQKRVESNENNQGLKQPKLILYWTSYRDRADFNFGFGDEPFKKAGCRVTNCFATNDRALVNHSDAVIFHAYQFKESDLPPVESRSANQNYIFYMFETIPNTTEPCRGKCLPTKYPTHYFNWTMTHRRDSDVYLAQHYGALERRSSHRTPAPRLPMDLPEGNLPKDPSILMSPSRLSNNRTKLMAWFSSHCPTHSRREEYIEMLRQFVPVDVYGKCGRLECLPRNSLHCNGLLNQYKFYFAAENSLCPDYVTEKFYRALDNGVVPVVYGGADYTEYAPPNSYINVADFRSPKELADYLLLLDRNDDLYMKYFDWKKDFEVVKNPLKGWCDLCEKLNRNASQQKSYEDVGHWWVKKMPCHDGASFISRMTIMHHHSQNDELNTKLLTS